MTREGLIHLSCLYGPLICAGLLAWWVRPTKRLASGVLFSMIWIMALLPWIDLLSRHFGLWTYQSNSPSLAGMPLALYFGWVIAWGAMAPLLAHALGHRVWLVAAFMTALDFRVMPELQPALVLGSSWWLGEMIVIATLLVPALWMAHWTTNRQRIGLRCIMMIPSFGGLIMGIPFLIECGTLNHILERWLTFSPALNGLLVTTAVMAAIPGLTAVRDLALSGKGTPVPIDPPRHLVTHGIYAYVRNPMQLSMTLLLLMQSFILSSPWPAVLAFLGIVYSEGLARWSEHQDMTKAFGDHWIRHRASVRAWIPHWHPKIGEPCELWLDGGCRMCSEVAEWFSRHNPRQLQLRDAREWQGKLLQRVTWKHPKSGRMESGVTAIAMALQHINLFWSAIGWIVGLPLISHTIQICMDAAGAAKKPCPITPS